MYKFIMKNLEKKKNIRNQFLDGKIITKIDINYKDTNDWIILRRLKTKIGTNFDHELFDSDIKRLYSTSLFDEIIPNFELEDTDKIIIKLKLTEKKNFPLKFKFDYDKSMGIFAEADLYNNNTFDREWQTNFYLNFGEYETRYGFGFYDPWIKDDKYKTSLKANIFLSREYPQIFKSETNGRIYAVNDTNTTTNDSFSSIVLEKTGGEFIWTRPLNEKEPLREVEWNIIGGINLKKVKMIDGNGNSKPYGDKTPITGNVNDIICIGCKPKDGSCPPENILIGIVAGVSQNKDSSEFNLSSQQFISFGNNYPVFNRIKTSYEKFIPINLGKNCITKDSDIDCSQNLIIKLNGGTILGNSFPPYEAFTLGGTESVRGWNHADLGVSKSFIETSLEYRVPIWRWLGGTLFLDAGTDFGSQDDVPGKPGKILEKDGSGYSFGGGINLQTSLGPLRLDLASKNLSGDYRFTFGGGWKIKK